jgi:hypothetical protein
MGIKIGPIDIGDTDGSPLNFETNALSGVYQPLADAATDVYEGVSDVVHEVGEVTGLDKIGDAIGDSPVAKAAITAIAAYYGMPYLAKYFGMAGSASGAATAAAEAAAWEAAALAEMGVSTAGITTNLMATGMSQAAATQAATMAATGASQSMIASTLAGGANQAAQIAYAADAASMGMTEAQIGADLVSMGMSNANAGFLAADAVGLAASGASSSAISQNMLNSAGLGSLSAPTAGGSSLWQKATDLVNPSTQTGSSLWNTVGNLGGAALASSYTDEQINRTRQIAADAAKAAEFKPYTISTPTSNVNITKDSMTMGLSPQSQTMQDRATSLFDQQQVGSYDQFKGASNNALSSMNNYSMQDTSGLMGAGNNLLANANNYRMMDTSGLTNTGSNALNASNRFMNQSMIQDSALNTQRGQTQALANQLYGRASQDPYAASQGLMNQLNTIRAPQNERDRLALEQRMAAQGRLGVATAAYGGTPEQLALAKAQQEQMAADAFNATTTSRDWLNQDIGAFGQMSQQDAALAQAIQQLQTGNADISTNYGQLGQGLFGAASNIRGQDVNNINNLYSGASNMFGQASNIKSQDISNISNLGNLGANMANTASNLTNADIDRLTAYMGMYYAPTQQARMDAEQALAAQQAAQKAAWMQGGLVMQGENAVAAALAKQQNDYLNAYNGMLGGTNAARTVNDVIGAGKSIWDLGKSFF